VKIVRHKPEHRSTSLGWLVPVLLLAGCGPRSAPEVYLIPAHYEGALFVQYSQLGYPPLPRNGDSLVLDFRGARLLRTGSPLITGTGPTNAFHYYYVDASGRRTRIRKVEDRAALHQCPPAEPCLVVSAGRTSQNLVSQFVTSAQYFERNDSASTQQFDDLLVQDTVSARLKY
jgi:hypothetical protein